MTGMPQATHRGLVGRLVPVCLSLALPAVVAGDDFIPPADCGLVNVKTDCGAKGDGATDDTAALRTAFEAGKDNRHPKLGEARGIYLPEGTYLVSGPIRWGDKRKKVRGQGRDKTIIRLRDNCPGFGDAANPQRLLDTTAYRGWHFAQNFDQRIIDLTIDVGRGNPGAIALEFHTNNGGGVFGVTIRSSDPEKAGAVGLAQTRGPGPGLIRDVLIDGFDVGSLITGGLHSMAFDRITLMNQRVCGFRNEGNTASISNLRSVNKAPALATTGGHVCLVNGDLRGGSAGVAAVQIDGGAFYGRAIRTAGYGAAIAAKDGKGDRGPEVDWFAYPRAYSLYDGPKAPLGLPIEEPPDRPPYGDHRTWAVIEPGQDSAERIQKAIDGGAEQVFLKGGQLHIIRDTISVRGRVRRIFGAPSLYRSTGPFGRDRLSEVTPRGKLIVAASKKPVWRIEDGEAPVVFLEFLGDSYGQAGWDIEHASRRTLVCYGAGGCYVNTITGGKAFFIDGGPYPGTVIRGPQKVWAWHTNVESYDHNPNIVNDGGTLWILGIKTEKDRTIIGTRNGGCTELMGGLLYRNRQRIGQAPAFTCRDASVALSYRCTGVPYEVQVLETRDGQTRELRTAESGGSIALFVGVQKPRADAK